MIRSTIGVLALLSLVAVASAQSSGADNIVQRLGQELDQNTPRDNAAAAASRAPGIRVSQAIARHADLAGLRLGAQNAGDTSVLAPDPSMVGGGSTGGIGGLLGGSLDSLLNTFLGSAGGDVTDAVGALTGGGGIPDDAIQAIQNAGIDLGALGLKADNSSQVVNNSDPAPTAESVLGYNPKALGRAQTSDGGSTIDDDSEPSFRVRWANAMLSTIFTSGTVALQTPAFIQLIEDAIRPIFFPNEDTGDDAADDGDGDNGDNGDNGDDGEDGIV